MCLFGSQVGPDSVVCFDATLGGKARCVSNDPWSQVMKVERKLEINHCKIYGVLSPYLATMALRD